MVRRKPKKKKAKQRRKIKERKPSYSSYRFVVVSSLDREGKKEFSRDPFFTILFYFILLKVNGSVIVVVVN